MRSAMSFKMVQALPQWRWLSAARPLEGLSSTFIRRLGIAARDNPSEARKLLRHVKEYFTAAMSQTHVRSTI